MATVAQPSLEKAVPKKTPHESTLVRVSRYVVVRLATLFVTVVIGIYLTIMIANMGGFVDTIMRGEIRDRVTQSIINNPAITHITWSDSIEYYMDIADIFVHPSHREGFPNVILQAGAMHLPVICSDIPGNADIIQDEKTGLMFEVKNEYHLYSKLKFAIENKERTEKIAHALFEEVTQLYNRKRIHEVILHTYNRLLEKHAST